MALHIVTSLNVINRFKQSRYFRINLGLASTMDKNGRRLINDKDKFAHFYQTTYKAAIYAQGNIGDIKFYTDHYIKDLTIAAYYNDNFEEFLFNWDEEFVINKSVDAFMGHILKSVEEQYEERVKKEELRKLEPIAEGNPEAILKNPGNVSYADLKAYLDKKAKERYKNNNNV